MSKLRRLLVLVLPVSMLDSVTERVTAYSNHTKARRRLQELIIDSGINPATLSGAIDVIVVRSIDADGNVTLLSSPFHVRFGKLQVLRAGEKRVTVKLPNNLPAPHIAPFSMKVGETGEAFFVLETDEDVPVDLLTSPVVEPTDNNDTATYHDSHDDIDLTTDSLTETPFGKTEIQLHDIEPPKELLGDVEYLDLNLSRDTEEVSHVEHENPEPSVSVTPASLLHTATAFLPEIPFLSNPPSEASTQQNPTPSSYQSQAESDAKVPPPNPLQAAPGEETEFPDRDHKLKHMELNGDPSSTEILPRVKPGEGEGPQVLYKHDVVLDMSGYHKKKNSSNGNETLQLDNDANSPTSFANLINDLIDATEVSRPLLVPARSTETDLPLHQHRLSSPLPPLPPTSTSSTPDLSSSISKMVVDDLSEEPEDMDRRTRGQSEPPFQDSHYEISASSSRHSPPTSPPRSPQSFATAVGLGTATSQAAMDHAWDWAQKSQNGPDTIRGSEAGRSGFRLIDENPYLFVFEVPDGRSYDFEISLCGIEQSALNEPIPRFDEEDFLARRISIQTFFNDGALVDDSRLVIRYEGHYWTWANGERLLHALSAYRKSLRPPVSEIGTTEALNGKLTPGGSSWSRWWRRGSPASAATLDPPKPVKSSAAEVPPQAPKHYAKTLRLSSDQLKQLNLKSGPNTIQFSVTSSYSGYATCSARIFLWEETDQIVISDIDGTITKSDALGHVFAAIGRDWTHLGIARLYTDISNNGYRILYLTSRAIGQADSTREYLRTIVQGSYRMPEGPVIMSPDRLMASLHREVIMRKPELFKMACLRDIQRLFGASAKEAFFAGFGNRITDAMSYRSVGIDASKIYTIDSTGVVKTELLQSAGHKGSYFQLTDLVDEVFPPAKTKFKPEFTDFRFWRSSIPDIPLPDLSPPSPALSARSDSSRLSTGVLSKIATLGRRSSKQPILPTSHTPSSRPSSPLMGPALTADDLSDYEDDLGRRSRASSMPGSFEEDKGLHFPRAASVTDDGDLEEGLSERRQDSFDDGALFDDDLLATGEMQHVPF